jgi:hypothetical protein
VLDSLSAAEQAKFIELQQLVTVRGAILVKEAEVLAGAALMSKLKAAAVFDMNIV